MAASVQKEAKNEKQATSNRRIIKSMKSHTPKGRDYSKCVHVHKRTGGQKICHKARTH